MCGIAGIFNVNSKPVEISLLKKMTDIIRYRGPDDEGFVLINTTTGKTLHCHGDDTIDEIKRETSSLDTGFVADLAFGFRRLSIIDLSSKGHQPMSNPDGSIWIVFNGEIYNYLELRTELQSYGYVFTSQTDTEVIINAYLHWGEDCLTHFNGMWSLAIWDVNKKKLFCARDRFGVKPFNYFFDGSTFIFGSEVKQILEYPVSRKINEEVIFKSFAIGNFLLNSSGTYFEQIKILPHSHWLTLEKGRLELHKYYDIDPGSFEKSTLSFPDACDRYRELFMDSVKLRMRSDVEVGSTLSGGLDSSAIVTVAAANTGRQFQTFTSYHTHLPQYDERKWAEIIVNKTNSKGHYCSVEAGQVIEDLSSIIWHHDYPLPGSSPVAQYYVMKLAQDHQIKVLLDGQGSDEIGGGYVHTFYRYFADLLSAGRIRSFIREYPDYLKFTHKGTSISRIIKTLLSLAFKESTLYRNEARFAFNPLTIPYSPAMDFSEIKDLENSSRVSTFLYNQLMATSIQTLLHYEDRNSMAHSIESRVPFLDYRLVELMFSLPSSYKLYKNFGKYIHREALKPIVAAEILGRKDKIGFLAPGEHFWMRNEMQPLIKEILSSSSFKTRKIFNHQLIIKEYSRYLRGYNTHSRWLWMVLMLELWFRKYNIEI